MSEKNLAKFLNPSATPTVSVRTAEGVAKDSKVIEGVARELNDIDPGMGHAVKVQGLSSPGTKFKSLIKRNPGKATAVGVIAALGSAGMYDELVDLLNSSDVDLAETARKILEEVDARRAAAGLDNHYPGGDGMVGEQKVVDLTVDYLEVKAGMDILRDAIAVAGGFHRFEAREKWSNLDPDLKQQLVVLYKREEGIDD